MNKVYWAIRLGLNYLRDNTGGRVYWEPLGEDTLKFATQAECNAYQTGARICSAHTIMVEKIGKYWVDLGHGYTAPPKSSEPEKVPTPASDSAKGERDRHGRTIIARNDYAMVVECPEDGLNCCVVDLSGAWWFKDTAWVRDEFPKFGASDRETAMYLLPLAARTPLPAAASLETPKVEDECRHMGIRWDTMDAPTTKRDVFLFCAVIDLKRELAELKREVAELKKASQ